MKDYVCQAVVVGADRRDAPHKKTSPLTRVRLGDPHLLHCLAKIVQANAIKLALIAEVHPIFCNLTKPIFRTHITF